MLVVLNDGKVDEVDEAHADHIARNLASSYPGTTAEMVREQLSKAAEDRNIIGMFAYGMLEDNNLIPRT